MGLGLAVALGASNTLETLTVNQYFHMLFRVALHLKVKQPTEAVLQQILLYLDLYLSLQDSERVSIKQCQDCQLRVCV